MTMMKLFFIFAGIFLHFVQNQILNTKDLADWDEDGEGITFITREK
jgi:hypothetical protein